MKKVVDTPRGKIEYRMEGKGKNTILVLHGGHHHCEAPVPHQEKLINLGFRLLIPSRPGYGLTPVSAGRTAEDFADSLVCLLDQLKIPRVIVLAISAGGRTALQLAGRHPDRVEKLVLQCALTHDRWLSNKMRRISRVLFHPLTEKGVWTLFRCVLKLNPEGTMKFMMKQLTTMPVEKALAAMDSEQKRKAADFLRCNRSGRGSSSHARGPLPNYRSHPDHSQSV
ncbi:alpha/beta hydrolase family protein [Melghirimyces profundicolus]|uniref:Alpha/beta hydrolase family protein n=1 Tax=Melghirimyces profundicolus TaxID=1242148 RepID=A0A2T6BV64_9BACL|nr:alpha/beta hydrolase [Melghirimyces profundicolus]PTX59971.1 alpha/beta hydrolase family protein [Melghirimyces profundicolus]